MFNGLAFLNKDENNFDGFLAGANFVGSNESSNLADIFEADEFEKIDVENPTLKYIPPKQNQSRKSTDKSTWDVVIAKIVGAFKLMNDVNTSQGQLGLALLKNPTEGASKLILYKTKEIILSTLQLTNDTKVYWKPPYLQYRDTQNEFWSLLFSSDADSAAFFAKLEEACTIDRNDITKNEGNATKPADSAGDTKSNTPMEATTEDIEKTEAAKAKSDVVYRVAKIGHQLPRIKPSTEDDSDSTLPPDVEKVPRNRTVNSAQSITDKIHPSMHIPPKPTNFSVALQSPMWSSSTFDLNSYAAENRIQNTEVRMNLSKLDTKLDRVLDNVERLWLVSSKSTNPQDKEEEIIKLEEKVLELKKENRVLKLQINEKVNTEANEKEKEEIATLQKINEEKEVEIAELTNKVQELDAKFNEANESKEQERQQLIEKHTDEVAKLREELEKVNNERQTLQQSIKATEENKESKPINETSAEMIRSIMNQFYVKLYQSIEGKDTLTSAGVLKLTAEIIRKETKAALNTN